MRERKGGCGTEERGETETDRELSLSQTEGKGTGTRHEIYSSE